MPTPRSRRRRPALVLVAALLALAGSLLAAAPAGAATPATAVPGTVSLHGHTYWSTATPGLYNVCPPPAPGHGSCAAMIRSAYDPVSAPPLTPQQLQNLYNPYNLGYGETVGIVDAYDDPMAEIDMTQFRKDYGLPLCESTSGCFRKVDESGSTTSFPTEDKYEAGNWDIETALDLDMVSALCPYCSIRLIESHSTSTGDFGQSENQAVAQGAKVVSNSWRGPEYNAASERSDENTYYNHPGVVTTAGSGDGGWGQGPSWPAVSQYVTAVGGTWVSGGLNNWTQHTWSSQPNGSAAGSGCSAAIPRPAWQTLIYTGCATGSRGEADVSAIAGGNGVVMNDTYNGQLGLIQMGGTSAATPLIAALYALNNGSPPGNPEVTPFHHANAFTDVNDASANGTCGPPLCVSGVGWDGPTGLGTPNSPSELADNGVLLYNPSNGYAYTMHQTIFGPSTDANLTFAGGWTSINQFGDGHLLFFQGGTGHYATGHKLGNGQVTSDYSSSGLNTNWSNFAPFGDGYLLFYAQGSNIYSVASHLSNGQLATYYTGSGLNTNWTSIFPLGDNSHLVFWAASTGLYSIAHHAANGQLVTDYSGNLPGYNRIVPFGDGSTLLATTAAGGWTVLWHSPVNGSLTALTSGTGVGTNWTSVTPFGNGSLLFYQASNGANSIGALQPNNTFAFQYDGITLPTGATLAATTY
jgi:hypothetical protein